MKWKAPVSVFVLGTALAVLGGGGHDHGEETDDHGHGHADEGHGTGAVTLWTDRMELFLEYPLLAPGEAGRCLVHLTDLRNFGAVQEGSVTLRFQGSGESSEFTAPAVVREGIFTPEIRFSAAGPRTFELEYVGGDLRETFVIDGFQVFPSAEAIKVEEEGEDEGISFLKEQQWRIDFRTEPVRLRSIRSAHPAVAVVLPLPSRSSMVTSPVDGVVESPSGGVPCLPGTRVSRGEEIARIRTPAAGDRGWASVKAAHEIALRDWERAKRLRDRGAVSDRDFDRIEQEYLSRAAGLEAFDSGDDHGSLVLRAPLGGVVTSGSVTPGRAVGAGEQIVEIADPDRVLLRVLLRPSDALETADPAAVGLRIPGRSIPLVLESQDFRKIGGGVVADPGGRIPVLLEAENRESALRFGQSLPVELYTGGGDLLTAVPRGSVFEEGGVPVVFVQEGGETFEMRRVELGERDGSWVGVLAGLRGGERVVTRGGYQVKLAATTNEIGHGHAH